MKPGPAEPMDFAPDGIAASIGGILLALPLAIVVAYAPLILAFVGRDMVTLVGGFLLGALVLLGLTLWAAFRLAKGRTLGFALFLTIGAVVAAFGFWFGAPLFTVSAGVPALYALARLIGWGPRPT